MIQAKDTNELERTNIALHHQPNAPQIPAVGGGGLGVHQQYRVPVQDKRSVRIDMFLSNTRHPKTHTHTPWHTPIK